MKKIILLFALTAGSVFAAMPAEKTITHVSTPFQLGFDENHCLYPKEYGVHGLRMNCFFVENRYMHGVDLGFWNVSEDAGGFQFALYRAQTYSFGGIQIAGWSTETKHVGGFQFAFVETDAEDVNGMQLTGLLGKARGVDGFQISGLSAVSESETGEVLMNGMQMGLFEARAENMNGVQVGGVFSEAELDANGIQLAALFAESTDTRGVQIGGLTARSKRTKGVQISGVLSRSELDADGLLQASGILAETGQMKGCLQLAGIAANVIGESDGVQIGGASTMAGSLNGWQTSLLWNYVFEHANGLQLSAIYNHAQSIHGVQIGLINHCSRLEGVQIGLLNTVQEARFSTCPLLRVDF
ncbi:hypothetical protein [Tichowtungia aerotolerans]|uniref:Uncharacterized protein n=1 Tax=Tichowtungia aerotolerans TaxID=2697043 RepID=A0A6P1M0V9_9BACT|nr:hypothetical protein [Tichowtungia aerotolerans]QHI68190.1 hypothetical protein GT409_01565 [Tichowtungia aerotolerans]